MKPKKPKLPSGKKQVKLIVFLSHLHQWLDFRKRKLDGTLANSGMAGAAEIAVYLDQAHKNDDKAIRYLTNFGKSWNVRRIRFILVIQFRSSGDSLPF